MSPRITAAACALLATGLIIPAARADGPFQHTPGLRLGLSYVRGQNTDDDGHEDYGYLDSAHYLAPELSYLFSFGTEPFVTLGLGVGGKESLLYRYGIGLRQRFHLGAVEPYVETGLFWVGEESNTPLAPSLGGGIDLSVTDSLSIGVAAGHYFSEHSPQRASLDWYGRAQLTWRFGR